MKKTLKNDILLVLGLLVLTGIAWGVLRLTRCSGGEAVVTVNGEAVAALSLSSDARLPVGTPNGTNTVEVSGGRVRVTEADCPDKLCARKGWIRYDGESIVCLPHKLVVTIRGGEKDLDAVAGG